MTATEPLTNLSGGVEADAPALRATEETARETHADGASGNANGPRLTGNTGPNMEPPLCSRPAGGPSNSESGASPAQNTLSASVRDRTAQLATELDAGNDSEPEDILIDEEDDAPADGQWCFSTEAGCWIYE